jgi:hypothetical protein
MSAAEEKPYLLSVEQEPNNDSSEGMNNVQLSGRDLPGVGNLNRVRDILFGAEMREYEKKFVRLEERLLKVSIELKDETRKSLDSLETYVKRELEALVERFKTEQNERTSATEDLTRELRETGKSLEKKIYQVDDQATRNHRDLRQQLLDQAKGLTDEMRQKSTEFSAKLDQAVYELRAAKIDRYTLASLLTEVALQLSSEAKISSQG